MTEQTLRHLTRLAAGSICLALVACAAPQKKNPPLIRTAERLNSRGITSVEQGRFEAAENEFAEAYKAFSRAEDHAGMVTVLVNGSRMYRGRGMIDKASAMAARAGEMAHHVPHLAAEVWFERAKVSLLQGDTEAAQSWADKALQASGEDGRAMIASLRADIRLKRGDWQHCLVLAGESLELSRKAGDRHEEADALRILADCRLAGGEPAAAADAYTAALKLDKELAVPRSIYADLKGLSASLARQGDTRAAGDYLLRAADIAMAVGEMRRAIADLDALISLDAGRTAEVEERRERLQGRGIGGDAP